jgi:ketosteroid isomerase-like protein
MTDDEAKRFADEWVAAWNSHDMARILSHYTEDFEITSPVVVNLMGIPSGRIKGKKNVAAYWEKALAKYPDLKFEFMDVCAGVGSVVVYYKSIQGRHTMETMFFNSAGLVERVVAHYR